MPLGNVSQRLPESAFFQLKPRIKFLCEKNEIYNSCKFPEMATYSNIFKHYVATGFPAHLGPIIEDEQEH